MEQGGRAQRARTIHPDEPAFVFGSIARARASLAVWAAAIQNGDELDAQTAAQMQGAMTATVAALTAAADRGDGLTGTWYAPLYQARDLLATIDRSLWNFLGGEIGAAPDREALLGAADMARQLLADFAAIEDPLLRRQSLRLASVRHAQ